MKIRRSRKHSDSAQQESVFFDKQKGGVKRLDNTRREGDSFFQPKLTVGRPGDRFEQQADAAADAVVGQTDVQRREAVQRQAAEEEEMAQARLQIQRQGMEEEEAVQAQGMEEEKPLQAQGMEEEETAQTSIQRQGMEEEETAAKLQRQADEEEEPAQPRLELRRQAAEEEEPVQAKSKDGSGSITSRLRSNRGRGNPLPPKVRVEMERALGADFSGVRLHTDREAVQMTEQLRAEAFTNGSDIYFNEGKLSPYTKSGKHLLAHELTHVVQQRKNR